MPKTELPEDFSVTQDMRVWADTKAPLVDIDRETETFIDHWLSNGEKKANWQATWRNWMRRAPQFGGAMKTQSQLRLAQLSREYQAKGFRAPFPNEDASLYETMFLRWRDSQLPQRNVADLVARLKR